MTKKRLSQIEKHVSKIEAAKCNSTLDSIVAWCTKVMREFWNLNKRPVDFREGDCECLQYLAGRVEAQMNSYKQEIALYNDLRKKISK